MWKKQFAQFFSLVIYFKITSSRKINAFKRTGFFLPRRNNFFENTRPLFFGNDRMPRGQFFDLLKGDIENRLNHGTFRGHHYYFVVAVIISGSNSTWVSQYKRITMSQKTGHGIATIPVFGGLTQYFVHLESGSNLWGGSCLVKSFFFERFINFGYGIVQKMADFLHHCDGVGAFFRVLAQINQVLKKLVDIGHIKISGNDQVAVHPIVLPQKGVYTLQAVFPIGAITHMAQHQFTHIRHSFFELIGMLKYIRVGLGRLAYPFVDFIKNMLDGLLIVGAYSTDIALSRLHIELNTGKTRPVLTSVVLFFHHQVHLVDAVQGCTVLFFVVS